MQRRLRVCLLLPPRKSFGAASRTSTLAPASRAVMAADIAALPPPTTSTSYLADNGTTGYFTFCTTVAHVVAGFSPRSSRRTEQRGLKARDYMLAATAFTCGSLGTLSPVGR